MASRTVGLGFTALSACFEMGAECQFAVGAATSDSRAFSANHAVDGC